MPKHGTHGTYNRGCHCAPCRAGHAAYRRRYKAGERHPVLSLADRFWHKVDRSGECWLWRGSVDRHGYGEFRLGSTKRAHRVAYLLAHGTLPSTDLDHTCRNRRCVRPEHLEPVSRGENLRRGWAARKTAQEAPE